MKLNPHKKIYFASDIHLGTPDKQSSLKRELRFVDWLDKIKVDAQAIFIVGDLWDFWFEYKTVIPKGNIALFSKLYELKQAGIELYFFTGNHDMWMFNYLTEELNIPIYTQSISILINGKRFFIGHGDGLGPNDKGYKLLKKVFSSKICQFLFRWIHPDIGISIAEYFSKKSRKVQNEKQTEDQYKGDDKEYLYQYVLKKQESDYHDYFIFGHRHLPIFKQVDNKAIYINLGDWLQYNTYAVFDGNEIKLLTYDK